MSDDQVISQAHKHFTNAQKPPHRGHGYAVATFICGSLNDPVKWGDETKMFPCTKAVDVPLINDGQYTNFNTPDGWHIELGYQPETTIVRCPNHCKWVLHSPGQGKGYRGHWEDN